MTETGGEAGDGVLGGGHRTEDLGLAVVTWVLAKHDGRWLIEAYHDCLAADPAA